MCKILATEAKLTLRNPFWAVAGVLLPSAVLLGIGFVPGMSKPSEITGGHRFIELWVPSLIVISIAMIGLQAVPAAVATYREQGVLRRLATTPMHPGKLLVAQLIVQVAISLAGIALMIGLAAAVFDVPLPRHPLTFAVTLVIGIVSLFSLGLVAAAVAPSAKAAGGIAMLGYIPIMFFGGVYLPRPLLPEVLRRIGDFVPPGSQPL